MFLSIIGINWFRYWQRFSSTTMIEQLILTRQYEARRNWSWSALILLFRGRFVYQQICTCTKRINIFCTIVNRPECPVTNGISWKQFHTIVNNSKIRNKITFIFNKIFLILLYITRSTHLFAKDQFCQSSIVYRTCLQLITLSIVVRNLVIV